MNIFRSIISLSSERNPRDVTYMIPYLTDIPSHVIILSRIKGIHSGKEDLRDEVVSKMIEELNWRQILGGFNQSKIRDILKGF